MTSHGTLVHLCEARRRDDFGQELIARRALFAVSSGEQPDAELGSERLGAFVAATLLG